MSDNNFSKVQKEGLVSGSLSSSAINDPKVSAGKRNGMNVLMSPWQIVETGSFSDQYLLPCAPTPATNSLTQNSTYTFLIKKGIAKKIILPRLIFNISESGGSQSVQCTSAIPGFIQRIEWIPAGGSGQVMQTDFGETLYADCGLLNNTEKLTYILPNVGLTSAFLPATSGSSSTVLAASGTQNYQVKLFRNWMTQLKPILNLMSEDHQMKLYTRNSVVTGSGTLSLNSLVLGFDHEDIIPADEQYYANLYKNNIFDAVYLDITPVSNQSVTITKQQSNKISLQNALGKALGLLFMLRSSVSPSGNGYTAFTSLGSQNTGATIQLLAPNGQDLTGDGTALTIGDLISYSSKNLPSTMLADVNMYFLPFGDVQKGLKGDMSSGYFYFDGSNINLNIIPDANFSNGTYQVDVFVYMFKKATMAGGRLSSRFA